MALVVVREIPAKVSFRNPVAVYNTFDPCEVPRLDLDLREWRRRYSDDDDMSVNYDRTARPHSVVPHLIGLPVPPEAVITRL